MDIFGIIVHVLLMVSVLLYILFRLFRKPAPKVKAGLYHCNMCEKELPEGKMALVGTICGKETNGICGDCIVKHKDILFREVRE